MFHAGTKMPLPGLDCILRRVGNQLTNCANEARSSAERARAGVGCVDEAGWGGGRKS